MKRINYILLAAALLASISLASCIVDSRTITDRYGIVQVEIAESAGAVTRSDGETMETIRLIVFTDLDTTPRAESNVLYRLSEGGFEVIPSLIPEIPAKVRFTVKVLRRDGATEEDKILIVAVINEPEDSEPDGITATLSNPDVTIEELEGIEIDMATFVKPSHLELLDAGTIPMTGALWTNYDKLIEERHITSTEPLELRVHRAVARVDVYLKRETITVDGVDVTMDPDLKMAAGTSIKLDRTYDRTNLITHTEGDDTIGSIQTVDPEDFIAPKTWGITSGEQAVSQFETTPVCVFYTPERYCLTDPEKLRLTVTIKTPEGTTRNGELTIKTAKDKDGITHAVDKVERNHIYKVTVTISANEMTAEVDDWGDQPIYTDF